MKGKSNNYIYELELSQKDALPRGVPKNVSGPSASSVNTTATVGTITDTPTAPKKPKYGRYYKILMVCMPICFVSNYQFVVIL